MIEHITLDKRFMDDFLCAEKWGIHDKTKLLSKNEKFNQFDLYLYILYYHNHLKLHLKHLNLSFVLVSLISIFKD